MTENNSAWEGFQGTKWKSEINVRDFITHNYTPYEGDDNFLATATERTKTLWNDVLVLMKKERENGGVLDSDTNVVSGVASHGAGYINKPEEIIVGLQTDAPLKRALMPYGGFKMVKTSCEAYGIELDDKITEIFTKFRKTHNDGVFDAYTPEIRACRKSGIVTGLPDAYGRGRIIGDYRRIALYGIDALITDKQAQKVTTDAVLTTADVILEREEISEQIRALQEMKEIGRASCRERV